LTRAGRYFSALAESQIRTELGQVPAMIIPVDRVCGIRRLRLAGIKGCTLANAYIMIFAALRIRHQCGGSTDESLLIVLRLKLWLKTNKIGTFAERPGMSRSVGLLRSMSIAVWRRIAAMRRSGVPQHNNMKLHIQSIVRLNGQN
jgi:hypothetical protein